ncbi:MAG: hypothetical protein JWO82_804 [Akkermansiaceae bacterium]|nr:hypothetical protein [Akkermansiaceae bacterium]
MRLRKNKTVHEPMTVAATGETGAVTSAGNGVSRVVPAEVATVASSGAGQAEAVVEISASVVKAAVVVVVATTVAAVSRAAVISAARVNCHSRPRESA